MSGFWRSRALVLSQLQATRSLEQMSIALGLVLREGRSAPKIGALVKLLENSFEDCKSNAILLCI